MFSQSATAGIPDAEVRRMAAIYRLVREHADAAAGTGPPVDAETNVLLGPRLSPIRTLPRVAPAVLAELRHQLPAADAADVLVSSGSAAPPTAGGDGRTAAEAALWRRVDAATMDPHSFARLVRASALGPGGGAAAAAAAAAAPGGAPGAAAGFGGASGAAAAGGPGRRLGAGGRTGRSRSAARAACPLSDARGRVEVDYRQVELLRSFVNPSGRLLGRRANGTTAKAQRRVSRAVKTARQMALLNPTVQTPIAYAEEGMVGEGAGM